MKVPRFELALTLIALVIVSAALVAAYVATERSLGGPPARGSRVEEPPGGTAPVPSGSSRERPGSVGTETGQGRTGDAGQAGASPTGAKPSGQGGK